MCIYLFIWIETQLIYNYSGFCQKVLKKRDLEIGYKRCKKSYEDFFSILKDCYYEIYNYFNSSDLLKNYKFSDFYDFSLVEFENIKNFNQDKIDFGWSNGATGKWCL